VSANNTLEEEELVFAFMTSNTHDLKVLATPIPKNKSPHIISHRSNKTSEKRDDRRRVLLNKFWSGEDPIIFCTQNDNTFETFILIDSGASDHCFAVKGVKEIFTVTSK